MPSGTDKSETAAVVDGPAISVDFEDRVWACRGVAAKVEGDDLAEALGLVGFAGVLDMAVGYAEGDGRGTPVPMGDAAVEEVAHDAEEGFFGKVVVLLVIFFAEERREVSGMEGGDVELIDAFAGDEHNREAFGVAEYGGAIGAGEESFDLRGSGIALVCLLFSFGDMR